MDPFDFEKRQSVTVHPELPDAQSATQPRRKYSFTSITSALFRLKTRIRTLTHGGFDKFHADLEEKAARKEAKRRGWLDRMHMDDLDVKHSHKSRQEIWRCVRIDMELRIGG